MIRQVAYIASVSVGFAASFRNFSLFGRAKIGARVKMEGREKVKVSKGFAGKRFLPPPLPTPKICFQGTEKPMETLATQATRQDTVMLVSRDLNR